MFRPSASTVRSAGESGREDFDRFDHDRAASARRIESSLGRSRSVPDEASKQHHAEVDSVGDGVTASNQLLGLLLAGLVIGVVVIMVRFACIDRRRATAAVLASAAKRHRSRVARPMRSDCATPHRSAFRFPGEIQ